MTSSAQPSPLTQLAEAAGIQVNWKNAQGEVKTVDDDVLQAVLAAMDIAAGTDADIQSSLTRLKEDLAPPALRVVIGGETLTVAGEPGKYVLIDDSGQSIPIEARPAQDDHVSFQVPDAPGYYRLNLSDQTLAIAISPRKAPSVADLLAKPDARIWGPVAQLYSLRSETGTLGGYGDFAALSDLCKAAAASGAHAMAISPVHAMFPADPSRYSPYGPSSRLFLNTAYVDPSVVFDAERVAEVVDRLELREAMERLDQRDLIEWSPSTLLRQKILRALYEETFASDASEPAIRAEFEAYVEDAGEALVLHACFDALHADMAMHGHADGGWRDWPSAFQDPQSDVVRQWAQAHAHEVRFHMFTQWLAQKGLAHAQQAAKAAGMGIGLIADLAVGTDPNGSHAWSRQADLLQGLSSGAPPDIYNPLGQGWGLTAFSPASLRTTGYAAFIEMLRAVLAHAGGIRIDHVIGLSRTWLIPDGFTPDKGAYVTYPLQDMLRLIALEAWRHEAIVIGENLGTVPEGFNDTLTGCGVMGMNVLFFERGEAEDGDAPAFLPPARWPEDYLSTSTTHDLPTCKGWWEARDLDWKAALELFGPNESETALRAQRDKDKRAMHAALFPQVTQAAPGDQVSGMEVPGEEAPVADMLAFVARGPQPLVLVPLEDILGLLEQPNIPGTIDAHPNWCRRLKPSVQSLFDTPTAQIHAAAIHTARSKP